MGNFEFTESMVQINNTDTTAWAFISIAPCLFILFAAAYIYSVPEARHTLDRLSFRLMLMTMVMEVGFNICYILLDPNLFQPATNAGCEVLVYFQLCFLAITNYLCTCIAVNLALCVAFHIDTKAKHFELWYFLCSLGMAFGITIIPAALGHFGYDPIYQGCYFTSDDSTTRLIHFTVDLYMWQALATFISTAAVAIVIYTLVRQGRETIRALLAGNAANRDLEHGNAEMGETQLHFLQSKIMGITIRISFYPIALFFVNTILTVGDMYFSVYGDPTNETQYGLYVIYNFLYGARSLPFAALGIFVDPSLIRGIRFVWELRQEKRDSQCSTSPLMMEEFVLNSKDEEEMDLFSALAFGNETNSMQVPSSLPVTYLRGGPSAPSTPKQEAPSFENLVIPELEVVPQTLGLGVSSLAPEVVERKLDIPIETGREIPAEVNEKKVVERRKGEVRRPTMERSASAGNVLRSARVEKVSSGTVSVSRTASIDRQGTSFQRQSHSMLRRQTSRRRSSGATHRSKLSPEEEELMKTLDLATQRL